MTKHYVGLMALLTFMTPCFAQNVAINEDGSLPNPKAILDVKSANKGILIPRMSTTDRLLIKAPQGLLVYDTTTNTFWYSAGLTVNATQDTVAIWKNIQANTGWLLSGNAADSNSVLGTTNNVPLKIVVNNQPSGYIDSLRQNTYFGYKSGNSNFVAADSPAIGNTAVGYQSLTTNAQGQYNTAVGQSALHFNTRGYLNTAIGYSALRYNLTGISNTATGMGSLFFNTRGSNNTADGSGALYYNTTGFNNTAVGSGTMYYNTTGSYNTAIGGNAFRDIRVGSYNTGIGHNASASRDSLTNATAIGYGAIVNASNKVRIGNSAVTVIEGQVPFTVPSDGRYKYEVKEDVKGLDFILQLRPVTYRFDVKRFDKENQAYHVMQTAYNEAAAIRRSGFIAQEVEKAAITSNYSFSGIVRPKTAEEHYSLSYESFVVPLVKAVQELSDKVEKLEKKNEKLEKENEKLNQLINSINHK